MFTVVYRSSYNRKIGAFDINNTKYFKFPVKVVLNESNGQVVLFLAVLFCFFCGGEVSRRVEPIGFSGT